MAHRKRKSRKARVRRGARHKCQVCGRVLKTRAGLTKHLTMTHYGHFERLIRKRSRRRYYHDVAKPRRKRIRRAVKRLRKTKRRIDVQARIDRARAGAISLMGFPPMIPDAEIRAVGGEGQMYHDGKWRPTRWSQGHGSLVLVDGVWTPT